jgi:creatinine amidohydrolase/Fe(II)-dependent formamide hydrolase-like protein
MELAVEDYGGALDAPETVFYLPVIFHPDPASGIDYSKTGVRGDPTRATVEKGKALLDEMTAELVAGLRALYADAF